MPSIQKARPMRIWIDITNSPHVPFFARMIRDFEQDHEVLLTCRPLANTLDLLKLEGFSSFQIGRHYGKRLFYKVMGFPVRIFQLYRFLKGRGLDVAVSHSSFYSPLVARMLGVRCIYLNDNEHAGGNRISFMFADTIMIPEHLDLSKIQKQGADPGKVIQYPGVKEGIYLWCLDGLDAKKTSVSAEGSGRKTIYVRPEPWTAQYYKGARNFLDQTLLELKDDFRLVLLPRGEIQKAYYQHKRFNGLDVVEASLGLAEIIADCDLFIGAGGTMTREAAVLGIPTISIYQDDLLDVDRYLIEKGFMIHTGALTAGMVRDFLKQSSRKPADTQLLHKGRRAFAMIKGVIANSNRAGVPGK
jgi:uncharacterized protein